MNTFHLYIFLFTDKNCQSKVLRRFLTSSVNFGTYSLGINHVDKFIISLKILYLSLAVDLK
jgi:hypothetical protein